MPSNHLSLRVGRGGGVCRWMQSVAGGAKNGSARLLCQGLKLCCLPILCAARTYRSACISRRSELRLPSRNATRHRWRTAKAAGHCALVLYSGAARQHQPPRQPTSGAGGARARHGWPRKLQRRRRHLGWRRGARYGFSAAGPRNRGRVAACGPSGPHAAAGVLLLSRVAVAAADMCGCGASGDPAAYVCSRCGNASPAGQPGVVTLRGGLDGTAGLKSRAGGRRRAAADEGAAAASQNTRSGPTAARNAPPARPAGQRRRGRGQAAAANCLTPQGPSLRGARAASGQRGLPRPGAPTRIGCTDPLRCDAASRCKGCKLARQESQRVPSR
jgi:hypothetical protein